MILIVFTAILAILYAVVSILPSWGDSTHKWALVLSSIFGIGLAILGIFTGIASQKSGQSTVDTINTNLRESRMISERQMQDSILNKHLQTKVDSQYLLLKNQSLVIDKLRKENTDLNFKLAKSTKEIYDEITGSDSYCQLSLFYGNLPSGEKRHLQYISFGLIGKYPLQNVLIRVINLNSPDPLNREEFEFKIGRVQNQIFVPTNKTVEMDTLNGVNLNIFYEANNGLSTQIFRMRYRNGFWTKAERFHHGLFANGKYLDLVDENYPFKDPLEIFVYDKK
jgi:hypothetical protein